MSRRDDVLKYFEQDHYFMNVTVKNEIEKNRKGNAKVKVVDQEGNVISGAKLIFKQKNHEFKHGANIFMLDEFEKEEKNIQYRELFKEVFNLATIPFYWSDFEPEQGKPRFAVDSPKVYRRPASDLCVNYCLENGLEPKCHCLNYDNWIPEWLKDADVETHKRMLAKRMKELSEHYADIIPSWEVTNETFNPYEMYQTKFYKEDDFVEWSFREADRYFPNNRLVINDYVIFERHYRENRSPYYMQIERLLRNGISHLDSIGMQYHSFGRQEDEAKLAKTRYNPSYIYEVLDTYAKLGKKLQITEITIPAFSNEEEDEAIQAELIKNIYTMFFGHKAMEAVIYWNLVDGYAAFAPQGDMAAGENRYYGGLVRFDFTHKPALKVLKDLFSKEWHTETESETNDYGVAGFRGFYGEYEVEISVGGKTYTKSLYLSKEKNNENTFVI